MQVMSRKDFDLKLFQSFSSWNTRKQESNAD